MELLFITLLISTALVLALPVPTAFSISSHADNRLSRISPIWSDDDRSHPSNETPQQAPFSDTAATLKETDPSLESSSTDGSTKRARHVINEPPASGFTATSSALEEDSYADRDGGEGIDVTAMVPYG